MAMGRLFKGTLAILIVVVLCIPLFNNPTDAQQTSNMVIVRTDYELLGFTDLHGGGHLTYELRGRAAGDLRRAVLDTYDTMPVIGNANGPFAPEGGIGVFTAGASIANTIIADNSNHGMEIGEGWFNVRVENVEITGNAGDGIHLYSSGDFALSDGSLLIQNNGGIGVVAKLWNESRPQSNAPGVCRKPGRSPGSNTVYGSNSHIQSNPLRIFQRSASHLTS